MSLNRRHFLAGTALAGAAAAVPLTPVRAQGGGGGAGRTQAPAFRRASLGDWVVTALADGNLTLNASVLPNASEEDFAAAMEANFLPPSAYTAPVNAFLLQKGDRTILVDTGGTAQMSPTLGRLASNLEAAGVAPGDVDTILLTHMHLDHIGGLLDGSGGAVFPNAELIVRANELAFWTDPAMEAQIPEMQRGMAQPARAVASAYDGRISPFDADGAVVDGIEAVSLAGHTPGHTGYRVDAGDASLLVWGDIVHIGPVQFAKPEVYIGFDVTPEDAVAARQRTLDMVASDRTMIAGMHVSFPGFGHVARDGEGYRFVVAPWQYSL